MSETSDLLRAIRATGLTQTFIAERTGIPQPRISKWEAKAPRVADDALKIQRLHAELIGRRRPAAAQPAQAPAEKVEAAATPQP